MDKEQKAMFSDMGKQAAYLYNGAFEVFQNSKQAEKIVLAFMNGLIPIHRCITYTTARAA